MFIHVNDSLINLDYVAEIVKFDPGMGAEDIGINFCMDKGAMFGEWSWAKPEIMETFKSIQHRDDRFNKLISYLIG